jgi:hypothetical protein
MKRKIGDAVYLRLGPELARKVEAAAARDARTKTSLVRAIVMRWFEQQQDAPEVRTSA